MEDTKAALLVMIGALVEGATQSGTREQREAGLVQLREGLAVVRQTTESELWVPLLLGAVAQGYAQGGQVDAGLSAVEEWLKVEEHWYEAELYRLKGELTLQNEARGWRLETSPPSPQALSLKPQVSSGAEQEAEEYFLKVIEIAQKQQAKSWELRAVISLARLWQAQGKTTEARDLLAPVYNWFTEGFDTKDLQKAKALLEQLT